MVDVMKKISWTVLLGAVVIAGAFLAGTWYADRGMVSAAGAGSRTILYHVDPTYPAYTSDKLDIAPDRGMQFEHVHSHGGPPTPLAISAATAPAGTVHIAASRQQTIG